MKRILWFLLVLIGTNATSQIHFGQPVNKVQYLLEYVSEGKNWEIQKVYHNGEVQEITVYMYQQLYYDLSLKTDAIDRYLMKNGKYYRKETQLIEVSVEYVKERFEKLYGDTKLDNYYFDDDYSSYQTIELRDGVPTITILETNETNLPKEVLSEAAKRKREVEQKQITKEEKRERVDSLLATYVNIEDYHKGTTAELYPIIEKIASKSLLQSDYKVGIGEYRAIKGISKVRLYAEGRSKNWVMARVYPTTSNDFHPKALDEVIMNNSKYVKLPEVVEKIGNREFKLKRETFLTLDYDLVVGGLLIRKNKSKIKVLTKNITLKPSELKKLEDALVNKPNGKYEVRFQIGTINDNDATLLYFQGVR